MAEGVSIRAATLADVEGMARVHVESADEAYAPLAAEWPAPDRAGKARAWAEWIVGTERVDLVAEQRGEIVGIICGGRNRVEDVDAELEIYVIHVLPAHRGRDIGGQLWAQACARLRGPELRSLVVDTFAELRCCSFYARHGGEVALRRDEIFHGGRVTGVVYRWPQGVPSILGPSR